MVDEPLIYSERTAPSGLRAMWQRNPQRILSPLVFCLILLAWTAATHVFGVPPLVLPPPDQVWNALVAGVLQSPFSSGSYLYHAAVTVWEALLGFIVGSVVGIALGAALAQWRTLEKVAYPYVVVFQSLPKVALAPLVVIWFGFDLDGKVIITAVITFFPLLVNTMVGYQSVEQDRIDLARSCNASTAQIFWKIILPSALPYLFAGLNVASVLALLGAIVGEFVGSRSGLGMLLMQYDQSMEIASVFAVLVILGIIGFLMNYAIRVVEKRCCFWAQHRTLAGSTDL